MERIERYGMDRNIKGGVESIIAFKLANNPPFPKSILEIICSTIEAIINQKKAKGSKKRLCEIDKKTKLTLLSSIIFNQNLIKELSKILVIKKINKEKLLRLELIVK